MTTFILDTLAYSETLKAGGFSEQQAATQARALAEKIRLKLAEPYRLAVVQDSAPDEVVEHHCSASIGLAVFNGAQVAQDDILKAADAAMYQAKEAGRNSVCLVMLG